MPIMFEHTFTKIMISQETIMDPCESLLDASLFKLWARWYSFLEFSHIFGHEVFPSWLRILELKGGPMYIQWRVSSRRACTPRAHTPRTHTRYQCAFAAGVVRVRDIFFLGAWWQDVAPHSCRTPSSPQTPLWFCTPRCGQRARAAFDPQARTPSTLGDQGLSHLTVAFDVSSSQRAFWRASVGTSSCKRPNKSVMTPFTFANGSSPVPASNFQISKCARRAEQARQSSYLATRLIIDTTSNPARCVDVSHQQMKLSWSENICPTTPPVFSRLQPLRKSLYGSLVIGSHSDANTSVTPPQLPTFLRLRMSISQHPTTSWIPLRPPSLSLKPCWLVQVGTQGATRDDEQRSTRRGVGRSRCWPCQ